MKSFTAILLLVACSLFFGCRSTEKPEEKVAQSKAKSESKYPGLPTMAEPITTSSGLQYVDLVEGTGAMPKSGKPVTVHYSGYLLDGTKFDSSVDRDEPFVFNIGLGKVIKGWDEGVATMKVGGKRKLIIPPALGYGSRGAGGVIPPDATLIFDVEVLAME